MAKKKEGLETPTFDIHSDAAKLTIPQLAQVLPILLAAPSLELKVRDEKDSEKDRWGKVPIRGLPVLLWGDPGIAKTSAVYQAGDVLGLQVETVILSIRESSDVLGLPFPASVREQKQKEQKQARTEAEPMRPPTMRHTDYLPPNYVTRLIDTAEDIAEKYRKGRTEQGLPQTLASEQQMPSAAILFLDELTAAPPDVQAAGLRIALERVAGDIQLPPTIAVVAAANPASQTLGYPIIPPLANRFIHVSVLPTTQAVGAYFRDTFKAKRAKDLPKFDIAAFTDCFVKEGGTLEAWGKHVGEFLEVSTVGEAGASGLYATLTVPLVRVPKASAVDGGFESARGFPTPRSWEFLARVGAAWDAATASGYDPGTDEVLMQLFCGTIGSRAGKTFGHMHKRMTKLPTPFEILADPLHVPKTLPSVASAGEEGKEEETGDASALILMAYTLVKTAHAEKKYWLPALQFVNRIVAEAGKDVGEHIAIQAFATFVRMHPKEVRTDLLDLIGKHKAKLPYIDPVIVKLSRR